ncbi:hypothetical protein BCR33DRAFT_720170 [Rhizoclosmatium globosum]|uniref:Diacylglycerol O-acyltransferase n=1 Tax=Rhizoclosmatium globosum TaxID=329046 RepID=A0A1Y2BX47_9FUNG|nr:hypothetical protein BCR33DRAFT_720170 [Rhizoclosmatium globosum]|eukprot:ORY39340.1 hypothetical protein BCR33DRAFT_720170 [Rhizoclosmatium globosum]
MSDRTSTPLSKTNSMVRWLQAIVMYLVLLPLNLYTAFMEWPELKYGDYKPPSILFVRFVSAPLRWLLPLQDEGMEEVINIIKQNPKQKLIFIGNHLIYGLDVVFLVIHIYLETGIYLRGIADTFHFQIPIHKHLVQWFGGVKGTVENCTKLMEAGQPILILPGGAEEVVKDSRIPPYTLIWKDRTGFAKLSVKHGYKIVPYGIVGLEDMVVHAFSIPLKPFFAILGDHRSKDKVFNPAAHKTSIPPPVPDMRLPVIYPYLSFQKSYLVFGEIVDASEYDLDDIESIYALRNRVRNEVETSIRKGRQIQFVDPQRYLWRRVLGI